MSRHAKYKPKANWRDYLLLAFVMAQAGMIIAKLAVPLRLSWWLVLIPGYPVITIVVIFIICLGAFAHTMSKYG